MAKKIDYEEMKETFNFLRQHPAEAVRSILNVDLPPHQRLAIKDAWNKPYNLWVWGRGCGKCQRGDTIVFTDNGMLQIGDELGFTSQEQMLVPLKRKLWGFSEEAESSHWYCDGNGPTKRITTNIGIELEGTPEHPILVMCEDGYMRMRKLENIKPGDYVVVEHGQNYFGDSTELTYVAPGNRQVEVQLPPNMTPQLAYWIGLVLGDGCFVDSSEAISFTGLEDTQAVWRSLTSDLFGVEPCLSEDKGAMTTYKFQRLQLNKWLEQSVGMKRSLSINKSIPISIRKAPKECVAAFLRGLFDTDGGVEHGGAQLYTSSKKLAQQVQIVLLNFGVVSSIQSKETDYNDAYSVAILSGFNEVFEREIGFTHTDKIAKLREHNEQEQKNGCNHNLFCVPHLGEIVKCLRARTRKTMDGGFSREDNYLIKSFYRKGENQSYEKIAELLKILHADCEEHQYLQSLLDHRYFFAEVTSVEDSEAVTYDFVVPEGQMFSGNGLVNHNTYCLALISCIAAILRPRTRVVMVGSSFRQCLTEDALVITENGIQRIADLDPGQVVASENGSKEVVDHVYEPSLNQCLKISLSGGHSFTGAAHHKTYSEISGNVGMHELADIDVGDRIPLFLNQQVYAEEYVNIGNVQIDESASSIMGELCANGGKSYVECSLSIMLRSPKSVQTSFLRALCDQQHGCSGKLSLPSEECAHMAQVMLLNMGIYSELDGCCLFVSTDSKRFREQICSGYDGSAGPVQVMWLEVTAIEYVGVKMTYDISVSSTHTYIANGILHHNSKFVMEEVGNIYDQAPYFRACCDKKIIHNPDAVTLAFKNGSSIRAMPLGDGGKIRGARAHLLVIDETAQVPPDIIDKVVMPMMSTSVDPMLSVRIQRMIDEGREVPQDIVDQLRANQFVMASSAYYQFNHLYDKFKTFNLLTSEMVDGAPNPQFDDRYALHVYDYRDLPKGFMDQGIIEHARVSMPYYDFLMEWQAVFPPDSEGFYRMSLLDAATSSAVKIKFRGDKSKVYVMGVDPARVSDNFAIVIIELGVEHNQVVRVIHLNNEDYYVMRDKILECMVYYNIERIAMDSGGGGLALKDLLAGEKEKDLVWQDETGKTHLIEPILDVEDETKKRGRRILEMVNFAPQINHEMATKLRAALQTDALKLPGHQSEFNPSMEEAQIEVAALKQELANIVAKPTRTGWPKYETIEENKQMKDRASALWLSNKAAIDLSGVEKEEKQELPSGIAGANIFAVNSIGA